jgi:SP family sugar:H+ symporter-like MFS transporter
MANTTNRKAITLAVFIAFGESRYLIAIPLSPTDPCCFVGGFLFGYDIGVISGCLIMPNFIKTFGELGPDGEYTPVDYHVSPLCWVSTISSNFAASFRRLYISTRTFFGALARAFTSDRFGRRASILGWSAVFTVGVGIQTATMHSIVQITVGRFVAGLGVGALSGAPLPS